MSETVTSPVKKTVRKKTTTSPIPAKAAIMSVTSSPSKQNQIIQLYTDLIAKIADAKLEFEKVEKEIADIKEEWSKEQKIHQYQIEEKNRREETDRKREQETYEYEISLQRKREQDQFQEKKEKWEKELLQRKQELDQEKKELEFLRNQVAGFDLETDRAVKEACNALQRELMSNFTNEKKLRDQEVKAEKELLQLRIENLHSENVRQTKEIEILKRALDESTRQVKEIAVSVIEARKNSTTVVNQKE